MVQRVSTQKADRPFRAAQYISLRLDAACNLSNPGTPHCRRNCLQWPISRLSFDINATNCAISSANSCELSLAIFTMAEFENGLNLESSVVDLDNIENDSIGVAFKRLQAIGASSREYQHTVGNYIHVIGSRLREMMWRSGTAERPIIHPMDGIVRGGEMLLVLGRPGSGCSTFLKTIAGDTYGFTVANDARVNYQGMQILNDRHVGILLMLSLRSSLQYNARKKQSRHRIRC
jgi:hypothetical protein